MCIVHDAACLTVTVIPGTRCMSLGPMWLCSARRELDDDDDDDVMLATSSPLKRTRSLGRLSRRWLARHRLGSKGTKPKDVGLR